jgi:predicted transcriptional regulator
LKIKTYTFEDIDALRKAKKVKKKDLCKEAGRHATFYTRWKKGILDISLKDANKCIEYLNSVKTD